MRMTCALGLGMLVAAGAACLGEEPPDDWAMRLEPARDELGAPTIVVLKTMPPQFDVVFTPAMPSAGHAFDVDTLDIDETARRVTARATLRSPQELAAQVITPTPLRLSLGKISRGTWLLEVWLRDSPTSSYRPVHALVLEAA